MAVLTCLCGPDELCVKCVRRIPRPERERLFEWMRQAGCLESKTERIALSDKGFRARIFVTNAKGGLVIEHNEAVKVWREYEADGEPPVWKPRAT